jgi:SAM-dependent methyltransferase
MSKIKSFFRRIFEGQIINALYLTYYYIFLMIFDFHHKTNFANSQSAELIGVPTGGTGNFPAHPYLVKKYLRNANLNFEEKIIDVGSGSGIALFVAQKLGYKNLSGVEFSKSVFDLSRRNLDNSIILINSNALDIDYFGYSVILFFSPFRGDLAKTFFEKIPENISTIIAINTDPIIYPILIKKSFHVIYNYNHFIYKNFNCRIFKRNFFTT